MTGCIDMMTTGASWRCCTETQTWYSDGPGFLRLSWVQLYTCTIPTQIRVNDEETTKTVDLASMCTTDKLLIGYDVDL